MSWNAIRRTFVAPWVWGGGAGDLYIERQLAMAEVIGPRPAELK